MSRCVLVTGSSTGIGRESALALAKAGIKVYAGVRKQSDADELKALDADIEPMILDVTVGEEIEAAARRIEREQSGGLLGVVNNAGVALAGPLEMVSEEKIRNQFEVNVIGLIRVTQAVLPLMRRYAEQPGQRARLIMMGSVGGRLAHPFLGLYCATKFALEGLADSWRLELAQWPIDVALIEPGSIDTPIWSKGTESFQDELEQIGEDGRRLYEHPLRQFLKVVQKTASKGIPPSRVADAVVHATTARRPKHRYLVGVDARIMARVAQWLPDSWRHNLVVSQVKGLRGE